MTDRLTASDVGVISDVRTWRLDPVLGVPWSPGVDCLHFVVVQLVTSDGAQGAGFSWTPSRGVTALESMIRDELAPFVIGRTLDGSSWAQGAAHLREVGSGGLVALALAGLDLAHWDLAGRIAALPVSRMIGGVHDGCRAYASGINWHFPIDELVQQVGRLVGDGADALKVKVGSPRSPADDRDRLRAVREVLGPDRKLMIDANQRWSRDEAAGAIALFEDVDVAWVEEPLDADDVEGYSMLCRRVGVPIAAGENLSRPIDFDTAVAAGVSIIQPNVVRVGGITPFLGIVSTMQDRGIAVVPHLFPEVSAQLASVLVDALVEVPDGATMIELDVLDGEPPFTLAGSSVTTHSTPGLGLRFRQRGSADREGSNR